MSGLQVGLEPLALAAGRERVASRERPPNGWSWQSTVSEDTSPSKWFSRRSTEKPSCSGTCEEGGVVDDRQSSGATARACSPTIVPSRRLASTARRSSFGSVTRIEFVTRAWRLNLSWYGQSGLIDRADGARGGDRRALRAEVDHGAGREQRRRGAREEPRFPRVGGDQDAAVRRRLAAELLREPRRGRARRAVVLDVGGVHREPVQREPRLKLRRVGREAAAQALRRGVERVAEHERLVGVDERERFGREQPVQVRGAGLDVGADAVDARRHPVQQRLRRGGRVQPPADPARELGGGDADGPEPVVQRVRAVQQLRLDAEFGEDDAVLPERRVPALSQKAVQQRRRGCQSGGILARRGKQPAEC